MNATASAVGRQNAAAKSAPRNTSLLRSTASVTLSTVLAKIAGAWKAALITLFFRPGAGLDAYLLFFLFISFVIDVFFGVLNPVLVPVLIEADERGGDGRLAVYGVALRRSLFGSIGLAVALVTCSTAVRSLGWLTEPGSPGLFNQML